MVVPLALSAATLGLGFLVAFSGPTLDLRGTWIVIPFVQAAGAAPVVVRIVLSAARSVDPDLLDAAASSGAGPVRRTTTVVWPALRRPVAVAGGFAFAMATGEFGATVFLSRSDRPTVPVLIGRLLGRPGSANLGQALALSCVLGLVAAVSVAVVDRTTADGPAF
jgi:thiamine transport system permease protein